MTKPPTLSSLIMQLEEMARDREGGLVANEVFATKLQEMGELFFRMANLVRRGEA